MGLNTIRLEGKLEDQTILRHRRREGILVMPGWCCCDHWEKWTSGTPRTSWSPTASLRDQILRLRGHPCVFTWLNGSDGPPAAESSRPTSTSSSELGWPNPGRVVRHGEEDHGERAKRHEDARALRVGPAALLVHGHRTRRRPRLRHRDRARARAAAAREPAPDAAAGPPLADRRLSGTTTAAGGPFKELDVFTEALDARYGPATGVEEYAAKAAGRWPTRATAPCSRPSRATSTTPTGVIQWMLNNAWPWMIWHLYDFYLRPGGGYFGAKKACEPLHVQYSYDDRSVVVVNSFYREFKGLVASAEIYNLDMTGSSPGRRPSTSHRTAGRSAFVLPDPRRADLDLLRDA